MWLYFFALLIKAVICLFFDEVLACFSLILCFLIYFWKSKNTDCNSSVVRERESTWERFICSNLHLDGVDLTHLKTSCDFIVDSPLAELVRLRYNLEKQSNWCFWGCPSNHQKKSLHATLQTKRPSSAIHSWRVVLWLVMVTALSVCVVHLS